MKTITRLLSLFIAAAILLGISVFSAVAADGDDVIGSITICDTCGENLTWSVENGVLTISGEGEMSDFEEHYYLAPWVREEYKEVVIGSGVKSIGNFAFAYSWRLESIVIPEGVERIGEGAFINCYKLKSISFPQSVTSIGDRVLISCAGLESITVAEGNTSFSSEGNCLVDLNAHRLIAGSKNTVIPDNGSVVSIADCAFYEISGITSITVPAGVETIEKHAFMKCIDLEEVSLPDGLKTIGMGAFYNCALKDIKVPDTVTAIGPGAFAYCYKLESANIPDGIEAPLHETFLFCTSLKSIYIPASVTNEDGAFVGCESLETITVAEGNEVYHSSGNCLIETATGTLVAGTGNSVIPDDGSVIRIYSNAFGGRVGLESIVVPESVTRFESSVFGGCRNLKSVVIKGSVKYLFSAFDGCTNLETVVLAEGVEQVVVNTFFRCSSLKTVFFPKSVNYIAEKAFEYSPELVMCVYENTYSHEYAVENDIPYYIIDDTYGSGMSGDIDRDGEVTVADALAVLRVAARLKEATPEMILAGDMDDDCDITVNDALLVLRIAAKLA
ncbi:MAG: leucine-rich repeat protein [Clostridia bacterium]|nr:leucine-rich repeat protein [Clostridia bacterium]